MNLAAFARRAVDFPENSTGRGIYRSPAASAMIREIMSASGIWIVMDFQRFGRVKRT